MLTDTQLVIAARKLCLIRGQDPDEVIGHSSTSSMLDVYCYSPHWKTVISEIKAFAEVSEAYSDTLKEE